jgi:hypothetical protein
MARHRRALPALAAVGLLLAGCGGDAAPERYALEPTRGCLSDEHVRVSGNGLDFVASTALGRVVIAFAESPAEAVRIVDAYKQFAGKRIPLRDLLFQEKNTVLLWQEPPTPQQAKTVRDCLDG